MNSSQRRKYKRLQNVISEKINRSHTYDMTVKVEEIKRLSSEVAALSQVTIS